MKIRFLLSVVFIFALDSTPLTSAQPEDVSGRASYAPVFKLPSADQGLRREDLMRRIAVAPFPSDGPWHFVSQAFGAYWTKDCGKGDAAIMGLTHLMDADGRKTDSHAANGTIEDSFHWQVFEITRLLELFGSKGVYAPHRMSMEAENTAKQLIWKWLEPRARLILVDPSKDWWIWGSENHHLQAWFSMWGALNLFSRDADYNERVFADGSTVPKLKLVFDDYFKRWIRNRATRGLYVECGSLYLKYSFSGFYNFVDFSDDLELRRLAKEFLDLCWTQWALEQVDGVRAGSRHRCYPGLSSTQEGACSELAWYHFGVGLPKSDHPSVLCAATTSYVPSAIVGTIVHRRTLLGSYEITSRQPGLSDPSVTFTANFLNDPQYPFYVKQGVYTLDPQCRSILRRTYATPDFILGSTMLPALPRESWSSISSQNRWDGVIFSGDGSPRIFIQPQRPINGSIYNAQWSVQNKGVLLIQRLPFTNAKTQRIWFSRTLKCQEKQGWIFTEAQNAYAAAKVVDGAWQWEPDGPAYWRGNQSKPTTGSWLAPLNEFSPLILEVVPKSGYHNFKAFQDAVLHNVLRREGNHIDYSSAFYHTTLTLFTDFKSAPKVDGIALNFEPQMSFDGEVLRSSFGSKTVKLHVFDHDYLFRF